MNTNNKILSKVIDIIKETYDTWTIKMKIIEGEKKYKAGQFLNIDPKQFNQLSEIISYFEFKKQLKEQIRAYSISSIPSDDYISITVKKEFYNSEDDFPPLLSPFLTSVNLINNKLEYIGYYGNYYMPDNSSNIIDAIHLVSGSGIVPSYSIIRDELINNKNIHVTHKIIYVNKTYGDIIFINDLNALLNKFSNRLKIKYFITRESDVSKYGDNFFKGRPTKEIIENNIIDKEKTIFFACGSAITKWQKIKARNANVELQPKFLETITQIVKELNIKNNMFKKEGW